ncbi:hypothetical protein PLESTB_000654100 [Pleodorina starrii]|uniref:Uncharacterized protein n=1 Tax=Pleodorina starrii TaxID=330485 RepID=A0A9W6BJN5_9CHLO|nr:hypothetical protein PLESTM_001326100 [Pleodorina starrii]GLC52656.1 hypothetical protein PLESTB_000654100 [Pleodorina starrii]GLC71664.1 hypothetical protein PLESTF_001147000 [Pleodorina starrii]
MEESGAEETRILFSTAKGEHYTHKQGYKQLFRRLRSSYRPDKLEKDDFSLETLRSAHIVVFGCPKEKFTAPEVDILKKFVRGGGSVLVLMSEGGEEKAGTNINYFLEQFGMNVNNDAVVRTTHYKYLHPKEVLISDGVLNSAVITGAGKSLSNNDDDEFRTSKGVKAFDGTGLEFVFPFGATLSVLKPAVPILSSGKIAYPMNRPVGAVWAQPGYGRIAVLGSAAMFDDKWLDKEENSKVMDFLFKFLKPNSKIALNEIEADEPEVSDLKLLPDTASMADKLKGCLQEIDELPRDWTSQFDDQLFKFDMSLIPESVALYDKLGVKKGPLNLIPPSFETPLPPLQPAVFPPTIREPPPPALELFDLDESFASETNRLASLTNKCHGDEDLEYYIMEAGHILGLKLPESANAKHVLSEVFRRIAQYKMGSLGLGQTLDGMGQTLPSANQFGDQFEL